VGVADSDALQGCGPWRTNAPSQRPQLTLRCRLLRHDAPDACGHALLAGSPLLIHRRIDRPLLRGSCPGCGQVVLRADGVSRQGVTCCGQVSGNRCHYCRLDGTAAALPPQPRRSCPLVVVSVDTGWSAGRLRTAGVRDPCHIAGQCPNPVRTTTSCNGGAAAVASAVSPAAGRVNRWADTQTTTVPAR
jgi:hypothetical protein